MKNILEKLEKDSVVDFNVSKDKTTLTLTECCDYYFSSSLTKAELEMLIKELTQVHGLMEEL